MLIRYFAILICLFASTISSGHAQGKTRFTRADTLFGANTPQRAWWDVTFYDLHVAISPADSSIRGHNGITYRVLTPAQEMQIDLLPPLEIDSVIQDRRTLTYRREGRAFFVTLVAPQKAGAKKTVTVYYHGKPLVAKMPPQAGGFVWSRDTLGNLWIATAVQLTGASAWWPNKDLQAEEPDSQRIAITVPDPMVNVSNGRLRSTTRHANGTTTYEWFVSSPINNYNVAVNAGLYAHFSDVYQGESGPLTLDFWPRPQNLELAKTHFKQVKKVLQCFESWFGPYPWYKDGYKLVETPYSGMEHQSAIAYGASYREREVDEDYIIVHESAHEWFGNNITTKDIADLWVHEGFATYAQSIYKGCKAGTGPTTPSVGYIKPIIGEYGVHDPNYSTNLYYHTASILHNLRRLIGNDAKWKEILRGLNKTFWHQTVTGQQVQDYLSAQSGFNLRPVFAQYLTTSNTPVLEYRIVDSVLSYRWTNVVPGFTIPVKATLADSTYGVLHPTETWQTTAVRLKTPSAFRVDLNYHFEFTLRSVP